VARILVADDNSNIQKMVGLALKDQGIDVVAVGNGEAAVRKISDIRPDLVLADVFMPVRNGYEVCQYVKSDSSLAHIPVILLVGAFDPLDEQEAQRVGADGVLKKPFVPPDPLISMVKSALARAGVAVGGVPAAPHVKEEPIRVAEMLTPRSAPPPHDIPNMGSIASLPEFPSVESEAVHDELPAIQEPVKIDEKSQPLAFGSLLESSETEQEEVLGYATSPPPELERDWKSEETEEQEAVEEEEEKQSASWRRDAGDESLEVESADGPAKDWRETAFSEAPAQRMRNNSWAPQKEKSGFEEAANAEQSVSAMVTDAPIAETKIAPAAAPPFTADAWAAALGHNTAAVATTGEADSAAPSKKEIRPEAGAEATVSTPVNAEPHVEPEKRAGSAWFSSVASPWDAEVQKANQLATTWDAPATSSHAANSNSETVVQPELHENPAKHDPAATVDSLTPIFSENMMAEVEEAALPAATVEAIREQAQYVAETAVQESPVAQTTSKTAEPSMEDLVAKVLSKMSPEMLQAVTREILKPVVEAMVREELNTKKE
jgi:CheY-like chemotaxis protein